MYMLNIQKRLLDAFESSNLTYEDLAKRTNLPKSALYRYLHGDTEKIPIDRFQAVCDELRVDAADLLGWKTELDSDEDQLLADYRSLSPRGKELLRERCGELKILYGKKPEDIAAKSV